jgi:hypothetical protein
LKTAIAAQYFSVLNAIALYHLQNCDRKLHFSSVLKGDRKFLGWICFVQDKMEE